MMTDRQQRLKIANLFLVEMLVLVGVGGRQCGCVGRAASSKGTSSRGYGCRFGVGRRWWGVGVVTAAAGLLVVRLSAVALAIIDLRRRRLPFAITSAMYLVCGVAFLVEPAVSRDAAALLRAAGITALTLGGLLVLALALPGQLGLGDVVFAGWIVLSLGWFSWRAAVLGLVVGLLVQLAVAGVLGLGSSRSRMLPMGPALLAGWVVDLFTMQG